MTALGWTCAALGGLVLYLALCVAVGRFCGSNNRTEPPPDEDYPTVEFPAIPPLPEPARTILAAENLLWGLTATDVEGGITLALCPFPSAQLGVFLDVDGEACGVRLSRAEAQDLRFALTDWLCTTAKPVAS